MPRPWARWSTNAPGTSNAVWPTRLAKERGPTPCSSWNTLRCTPRGRLGRLDHLLLGPAELAARGIGFHETDRGGQVTYHGPGQLVAYPVVDLRQWGGPLKYVRTLERVIIATLNDFGIRAEVVEGLTGVWAVGAKVAAIGVKISRGVATPWPFYQRQHRSLVLRPHRPVRHRRPPVTSMAQLLGQPVDMEEVQYSLIYHFGRGMGFKMEETDAHFG